jgi:hypothetical protein
LIGLIGYQADGGLTPLRFTQNGWHNLMEVSPHNPTEQVRLKRFPPGFFDTMVDWTTTQLRRVHPQGVLPAPETQGSSTSTVTRSAPHA